MKMNFFILAGGFGKRTLPLSLIKPKPAFPLHGTPLINIMLEQLRGCGLREGFINLHHLPQILRDSIRVSEETSIQYFHEEILSGSKILSGAASSMGDWLLILNGDMFVDFTPDLLNNMLRDVHRHDADGLLLLRPNSDPRYSAVLTEDGYFSGVRKNNGSPALMYPGIALFNKKIIQQIHEPSYFQTFKNNSFKIRTLVYDRVWLDIGNPAAYFNANWEYCSYMNIPPGDSLNSFSQNVSVSPRSSVSRSIIWDNTRITGKSKLTRCIVTGDLELHDVEYSDMIIYNTDSGIETAPWGW